LGGKNSKEYVGVWLALDASNFLEMCMVAVGWR
jgi:hypothetical protein